MKLRFVAFVALPLGAITLSAGAAYAYWTGAVNGPSQASAVAGTLGAPPQAGVTAAPGSTHPSTSMTVSISTGPSSPSATGYNVYAAGDTTTVLCPATAAPSSCTVPNLTPNTSYQFDVHSTLANWTSSNKATTASVTTSKQATTTTLSNITPTSGTAGSTPFSATATVGGNDGYGTPAGSVVFSLYTASDCSGSASYSTSAKTISSGAATGSLSPSVAGTYYWKVAYTPSDTYNTASTSTCSTTSITVNSAASQIAISAGNSQSATVATAFSNNLVALVTDSHSNPVSGVAVTFTAPGSRASGTFVNGTATTTATSGADGKATSSAFTANTVAGAYNVSASATGTNTVNFSETNTPAAASQLVFTTQPGSDTGGGALATQPQVSVKDQYGNVETGDNATTVTLAMNTGTGPLVCYANGSSTSNLTTTVSAGVATFSGCAVQHAGTGDKIQATSTPAHGTAVSTAFNVTISSPTTTFPTSASQETVKHGNNATFTVTGTGFASGAIVSTSGGHFTVTSWSWTDSSHISVTVNAVTSNQGIDSLVVTNPDGGTLTSSSSMVNN